MRMALAIALALGLGCGPGPAADDPDARPAGGGGDGSASSEADGTPPLGEEVRPEHVILIDWDGFDPSYLELATMPNLERLIDAGSLTISRGIYKTISNPSRASIATGAYPEIHKNVAYVYDQESGLARGQSRFLAAETLTQALARQGKTTASVQWYIVQNYGNAFGDAEHLYVQPGGDCVNRINAAIDILKQRPVESAGELVTVPRIPDFLAVYCSEVDGLGHVEGPRSPNIPPLLEEMDFQLGRLLAAVEDVGIFDTTAFLLVTDHGMTGWSRTLQPKVMQAIRDLGFTPERPGTGNAPSSNTDVILTAVPRTANVYLRGAAATDAARAEIIAAIRALPEVERVYEPDDLRELRAAVELEGDFIIEPAEPYAFAATDLPAGQERGGHSALSEIGAPLILSGTGICPGAVAEQARLIDIAPTVAALLGVEPPADAQGRPLTEALHLSDCEG
jgi:predicted AlkP superfamily pyrophosphatase or phosphodiesterase